MDQNYELAMDMLDVSDVVCAKHLTMMLEGPARTWFKNLPPNSINTWGGAEGMFYQKLQGTCKRLMTIVDLQHRVQRTGESAYHWTRRVAETIHSDSITTSQAILILEKKLSVSALGA